MNQQSCVHTHCLPSSKVFFGVWSPWWTVSGTTPKDLSSLDLFQLSKWYYAKFLGLKQSSWYWLYFFYAWPGIIWIFFSSCVGPGIVLHTWDLILKFKHIRKVLDLRVGQWRVQGASWGEVVMDFAEYQEMITLTWSESPEREDSLLDSPSTAASVAGDIHP